MTLTYEIDRNALIDFLRERAAVELDTEGAELTLPFTFEAKKLIGWRDTGEKMKLTFRTQRLRRNQYVIDWLTKYLSDGPKNCTKTKQDALKDGIPESSLKRAKRQLGVKAFSVDEASREWNWVLPEAK